MRDRQRTQSQQCILQTLRSRAGLHRRNDGGVIQQAVLETVGAAARVHQCPPVRKPVAEEVHAFLHARCVPPF